jgi:uncharacterized damage-inducible protein DinB
MLIASEHFIDLFHYNDWANRKTIDALAALGNSGHDAASAPKHARFEQALALLSHLLRAQVVWLGRVQASEDAALPFWEQDTLDACTARSADGTRRWLAFLEQCTPEDFAGAVSYTNSQGRAFSSTLREIATHVINHSTHHRAQIARLLREAGATPPATDYIFYARSSDI